MPSEFPAKPKPWKWIETRHWEVQFHGLPSRVPWLNEDDHFDFDKPANNFTAAITAGASWGYFDFRMEDEGFDDGCQSVPVNWGLSSPRKRAFFKLLSEITGAPK